MPPRKKHSKNIDKKRSSRDAALMKGTEELMTLGIDLEFLEPTAGSVTRLAEVRTRSPEVHRAVACWLGFAPIPAAAALLAAMEASAGEKDLKREIRRSLFRLQQRGIEVPERTAIPSAPPPLAREGDRGYLSPVDSRGDQVIWYVKEERGGDYYVLSGVVNDRRGMIESDAGRVGRPALRNLVEGTRKRFSIRLLVADPRFCDRILHEAYRKSDAKRRAEVSRFPIYRMEISHQVPEKVRNPAGEKLGVRAEAERPALLAGSGTLLEEPELSAWTLDEDWLAPHLETLREMRESPLVLNRLQEEERMARLVREAESEIFRGPARPVYRDRLEVMAYYFLLDGREDAALKALAVASFLDAEDAAGFGNLPFVAELTRRSLAAAERAEETRAQESRRSSLIVKPGEA